MNSSDFRKEAREKLSGKWGKSALIAFIYVCISSIISLITQKMGESPISILMLILEYLITIPLAYGLTDSYIKIFDNKEVSAFDFIPAGFNNFSRSWGVTLNVLLKMLLPIVLLILSIIIFIVGGLSTLIFSSASASINNTTSSFGAVFIIGLILYIASIVLLITWSYYYQLSQIIAIDNPDLTTKEAVMKSKEYMTGNRWKLFCLEFSFIGWAFLAVFTLGIGYFWLMPYMLVSQVSFARFVYGKNKNETPLEINENN